MLLSEVFQQAGVIPDRLEGDTEASTWVMDSRAVSAGDCFVCMPSENTDSHLYLEAARDRGAVAAVVHSEEGFARARSLGMATALIAPSISGDPSMGETTEQRIRRKTGRFSDALWRLAKVAFGDPSSKLTVFGVTGTNGKTTTAWLIRDMMNLLDVPCAYIGTLGFGLPSLPLSSSGERGLGGEGRWDEELRPLANTTPFAIELNAMLAEAVERGCKAVAMEVSSHALAERRCDGVEFDVAVFTNLSQDHLDYHGTMEAYLAAKARLFGLRAPSFPSERRGLGVESARAVINVGDPTGAQLAAALGDRVLRFLEVPKLTSFGDVDPRTDIEGCAFEVGLTQIHLVLQSRDDGDHGFFADLGGGYNVQNLIAAVSAVKAAGYPMFEITQAITTLLRPVPGRFEPVPNGAGIGIIVDYAHTPDALDKLLETARPLTKGRIITVFGCGGDRDKSKRPLMAQAADRGSDVVVITSDNPRTEDPDAIIADILSGLPTLQPLALEDGSGGVYVEPDRPAAVALAIKLAKPGDCVIIAGKGHENYQIIGRTKYPMDDRELAREGLRQR